MAAVLEGPARPRTEAVSLSCDPVHHPSWRHPWTFLPRKEPNFCPTCKIDIRVKMCMSEGRMRRQRRFGQWVRSVGHFCGCCFAFTESTKSREWRETCKMGNICEDTRGRNKVTGVLTCRSKGCWECGSCTLGRSYLSLDTGRFLVLRQPTRSSETNPGTCTTKEIDTNVCNRQEVENKSDSRHFTVVDRSCRQLTFHCSQNFHS